MKVLNFLTLFRAFCILSFCQGTQGVSVQKRLIMGNAHEFQKVAHAGYFGYRGKAMMLAGHISQNIGYNQTNYISAFREIRYSVENTTNTVKEIIETADLDAKITTGTEQDLVDKTNYLIGKTNDVGLRMGFQRINEDENNHHRLGTMSSTDHHIPSGHVREKRAIFVLFFIFLVGVALGVGTGYGIANAISTTGSILPNFAPMELHDYDLKAGKNTAHHVASLHTTVDAVVKSTDLLTNFTTALGTQSSSTNQLIRVHSHLDKQRWILDDFDASVHLTNNAFRNIAFGRFDIAPFTPTQLVAIYDGINSTARDLGYLPLPKVPTDLQGMPTELYMPDPMLLSIVMGVPLVHPYSEMAIYQYKTVPVASADGVYTQARPESKDILAINSEHGMFTVMTSEAFDNCWQEKHWRLCDNIVAFWDMSKINLETTTDTDLCVYAIKKENVEAIRRLCITEHTAPRTIHEALGEGQYLYGSHEKQQGVLHCVKKDKILDKPVITVHDTTVLEIGVGCRLEMGPLVLTHKVTQHEAANAVRGEIITIHADITKLYPEVNFTRLGDLNKEIERMVPNKEFRQHESTDLYTAEETLRSKLGELSKKAHEAIGEKQVSEEEQMHLYDLEKAERVDMRHKAQIFAYSMLAVFLLMLCMLIYLFMQNREAQRQLRVINRGLNYSHGGA